MFALRSIARTWQDRASNRHIGAGADQDEDGSGASGGEVAVSASKVAATAVVGTAGPWDLLKSESSLLKVHEELRKQERAAPGQALSAQVALEAHIGLSGSSAASLSSAVKTTSFLFEQLLGDLDAIAAKDKSKKAGEPYRQELVENFHAHMTEALEKLSGQVGRELNESFESVEDLLSQGAEAYIAHVRELLKNDMHDQVTVWYRGLKYDAYLPRRRPGSVPERQTLGTVCWGATGGALLGLVQGVWWAARGLCSPSSVAPNGEGGADYAALEEEGEDEGAEVGEPEAAHAGATPPVAGATGAGAAGASGAVRPRRGMRVKPVLKDLSGVLRYGRLTLVMGPPGCGKTSYLRAISGQLHTQKGVRAKVSGEVRYNWFLVEQLKRLSNWATYVSQSDVHLPLLTVRETLTHAWRCRKSARNKDPRVREFMERRLGAEAAARLLALGEVEVDFVLATLGLSNCADTIIGDATLKGVSGGEKRRVTLGEMLVTGANVVALDEISTGLDSAATFDICKYLGASAHFLGQMVVVALLQPPPEVVNLFDDIVLLAEGNVIYHGPREAIADYFLRLGYKCPERKDLGDFLQELPTPSGADFLLGEQERKALGLAPLQRRPPRTADEFGQAWKQSQEGRRMLEEVAKEAQRQFEAEEASLAHGAGAAAAGASDSQLTWDDMPESSFLDEVRIVLAWSWRLKMANRSEVLARVFQNVFMGLIFGSLFWRIPGDQWYLKFMLMAQMPGFMLGSAIGSVPKLVQERAVMYKQTAARFYRGTTFVLCQFLVQVPFTIFDAFVFGNLLYWMCGLAAEPYRYGMFMLLAMTFGLALTQMMRVFAYVVRDSSSALVFAVLSYLLFLVFSGQIATPEVIPAYMRWMYHINPLAWVYRALVINEFKADAYQHEKSCEFNTTVGDKTRTIKVPDSCGDFYLQNRQFSTDEGYIWLTVWVLLGYMALFLVMTVLCVTYTRFDRAYTESEEAAAAGAAAAAAAPPTGGEHQQQQQQQQPRRPLSRNDSVVVQHKAMVFSDLWYTIKLPKKESDSSEGAPGGHNGGGKFHDVDLLKGVSGWALPGRMTALMGSSGAGKTTLLDVLADRKTTGIVTGHILVNGEPPDRRFFRRMVGYVEQFGVHAAQASVEESLTFSAALRLPQHQQHKAADFVADTMELLELGKIANELTVKLSVEENKRLTIAVELVANPSILFADEPTSGLDARAASIVMRSIQNVARSGRTVICTIHQPSIAVFTMFDDLLLMRRGGSVVFFGELGQGSANLIRYFEAIPGTKPCPVGYNPATWMLEVIGAGTSDPSADAVDFAAVYRKSKLAAQNRERLLREFGAPESRDTPLAAVSSSSSGGASGGLLSPAPNSANSAGAGAGAATPGGNSPAVALLVSPQRKRLAALRSVRSTRTLSTATAGVAPPATSSSAKQIYLLLQRCTRTYWRSPEFSLSRLVVIVLVGMIVTSIFWQEKYDSAASLQSRINSITFIIMLAGIYNCYTILPFTIEKRALFYREVGSGMYSKIISVASDGLIEIPYVLVEALLGINIIYWGVGLRQSAEAYAYYCTGFVLYVYLLTCLGMWFAWLMPDALSAQLFATIMTNIFQLFAGVIVPYDHLPSYYKFLFYFSPQHYLMEGTLTTQFHADNTLICDPLGKPVTSVPPELKMKEKMLVNKVCTHTGGLVSLQEARNQAFTGVVRTAEEYVYSGPTAFLHGYSYESRWSDVFILVGWILALRMVTALCVLLIDHNKR
jgi:ABC-type multidrug transport system ATPase subunit